MISTRDIDKAVRDGQPALAAQVAEEPEVKFTTEIWNKSSVPQKVYLGSKVLYEIPPGQKAAVDFWAETELSQYSEIVYHDGNKVTLKHRDGWVSPWNEKDFLVTLKNATAKCQVLRIADQAVEIQPGWEKVVRIPFPYDDPYAAYSAIRWTEKTKQVQVGYYLQDEAAVTMEKVPRPKDELARLQAEWDAVAIAEAKRHQPKLLKLPEES
jgi:hypothetical protein